MEGVQCGHCWYPSLSSPVPMLLSEEESWGWTEGEGRACYGQVGRVLCLGGVGEGQVLLQADGGGLSVEGGHARLQGGDGVLNEQGGHAQHQGGDGALQVQRGHWSGAVQGSGEHLEWLCSGQSSRL